MTPAATFSAKQIATALNLKRQRAQKLLGGVTPAGVRMIRGNEANIYALADFPSTLLALVEEARMKRNLRTQLEVFTRPHDRAPLPALETVADFDIQAAIRLRDAFQPFLLNQHQPGISALEWKQNGVEAYRRVLGHTIGVDYWFKLFRRIVARDSGAENFSNLQIYLSENPQVKPVEAKVITASPVTEFEKLGALLAQLHNPLAPDQEERKAVWAMALREYTALVHGGTSEKTSARRVRSFLFDQAKFIAPTRHALRMKFERELAKWNPDDPESLADGRKANGNRPEYPGEDIKRLRASAFDKNGGRIDAAWREEYSQLSEYTRQRHPFKPRCPASLYRAINRTLVDALVKVSTSDRETKNLLGRLKINHDADRAMSEWSADDVTSNIQCFGKDATGQLCLFLPQIVAVMDNASRKIVGDAVSNDKSPTSRLVCAAVKDAFIKHGVPGSLGLENGWVFGRSLNVNGKEDDQGRMLVSGLGQYGCTVRHFQPGNPTSKADLENSFNLMQKIMERHPGYGGRNQRLDASDDFKREERLINSGKVPATNFRYTFEQFTRAFRDIVEEYNSTPQFFGRLKGLSPNEAFEALRDQGNPPMKFDNKLRWLLDERYRVFVEAGGVKFSHYGKAVQVRGGELPQHIGTELWALVDRNDDSMVTFMTMDYRTTFTLETCQQPSAAGSRIITSSDVIAAESQKLGAHRRALKDEVQELRNVFGNPRHDLLAKYRGESKALPTVASDTRTVILNSRMEASAGQMETQRQAITAKRQRNTANKSKARRMDIPDVLAEDDDQTRRALELRAEARRESPLTAKPGNANEL